MTREELIDGLEIYTVGRLKKSNVHMTVEELQNFIDEIKALDQESNVEIPDNASNGEVIKAIFPNAKFNNAEPFTDGRWETINLDTENTTRATYKPTQLRTYADWWDAPYRAESEER